MPGGYSIERISSGKSALRVREVGMSRSLEGGVGVDVPAPMDIEMDGDGEGLVGGGVGFG